MSSACGAVWWLSVVWDGWPMRSCGRGVDIAQELPAPRLTCQVDAAPFGSSPVGTWEFGAGNHREPGGTAGMCARCEGVRSAVHPRCRSPVVLGPARATNSTRMAHVIHATGVTGQARLTFRVDAAPFGTSPVAARISATRSRGR